MQLAFNIAIVVLLLANLGVSISHMRAVKNFGLTLDSVRKVNQHGG